MNQSLPRLTVLIDSLGSGGAQRQVVELATRLHRRGWPVVVCTYHEDPFFEPALEAHGVEVQTITAGSPLGRLRVCRRLIRRTRPDIVASFVFRPNTLAELLRFTFRRPYALVVSERTMDVTLHAAARRRIWLHTLATAVVTNSVTQAGMITRAASWLASRTSAIRNCVDLETFRPVEEADAADGLHILTLASFVPSKNPSTLVEGFARYVEQTGDASASVRWRGQTFVDEQGPTEKSRTWVEATRLAHALGVADRVQLEQRVADVTGEYRWAHVVCLPSSIEGCPNVVCEALACGLPVLAGAIGDVPSLVQDGVHGFLFDPTEPEEVAAALRRYQALSASERAAMSARCRQRAIELFSPDDFVDAWEGVLLAARPDGRRRQGREVAPTPG